MPLELALFILKSNPAKPDKALCAKIDRLIARYTSIRGSMLESHSMDVMIPRIFR